MWKRETRCLPIVAAKPLLAKGTVLGGSRQSIDPPTSFAMTFSQRLMRSSLLLAGLSMLLVGCETLTTDRYEATAQVTYTWQVQYSPNLGGDRRPRIERFATATLENRNGTRPDAAATGPDDRGLYWPALPPRPTVDELEDRRRSNSEEMTSPELVKAEDYAITFEAEGRTQTLPTNYDVYRQVVRALPDRRPLELTLGTNGDSVLKAE